MLVLGVGQHYSVTITITGHSLTLDGSSLLLRCQQGIKWLAVHGIAQVIPSHKLTCSVWILSVPFRLKAVLSPFEVPPFPFRRHAQPTQESRVPTPFSDTLLVSFQCCLNPLPSFLSPRCHREQKSNKTGHRTRSRRRRGTLNIEWTRLRPCVLFFLSSTKLAPIILLNSSVELN